MIRMPNAFQRVIHRVLMSKPLSAFLSTHLHRADSFMLHITAGSHTFTGLVGLPVAQLTTVGAKTGRPHIIALVAIPNNDRLVLLATNFGQKHNPAWYYNLKAHPQCQVQWKGSAGIFIA